MLARRDETTELVIAPQVVVEGATEQARVLMDVVTKRKLFSEIDGKQYLEAEAWEIILAFNKAHPVPEWVRPIMEDGQITGYVSRVNIMQNGQVVAAGEMPCGFDDFPCRGKEGAAKHRAAMSAAQTWALSKAARMKFAWVAVLGGYAPTPADEIKGGIVDPKDNCYHCAEHDTNWRKFEKDEQTWYSHKIAGTEKWCNMKGAKLVAPDETSEHAYVPLEKPTLSPSEPVVVGNTAAASPNASREFDTVTTMWKALEDAGYTPAQVQEAIGLLGAHMTSGGTRGQYFDKAIAKLGKGT